MMSSGMRRGIDYLLASTSCVLPPPLQSLQVQREMDNTNPWRRGRMLGKGAFGTVHIALDEVVGLVCFALIRVQQWRVGDGWGGTNVHRARPYA